MSEEAESLKREIRQLKSLNESLEKVIKDRTSKTQQLFSVNQQLNQFKVGLEKVVKERTTELSETLNYLQNILASMLNSLIVTDTAGNIQMTNKATLQMLSYDQGELVGKPAQNLVQDREITKPFFLESPESTTPRQIETTYLTKEGKMIPILLTRSPLYHDNKPKGIVFTAQDITERKKNEELALTNAKLEQVSQVAHQVQTALLLEEISFDGFDIALCMIPAEEVGGDFYDFLEDAQGMKWLAIGDVSGHGMHAGMIMMMAQSALSALIKNDPNPTPTKVLAGLNNVLYENIQARLKKMEFMTFMVLKHLGEGRFVCAGSHENIVIYREALGKCETIMPGGVWMGIMPDIVESTQEVEFALERGDILVLYTDGVIEAQDSSLEQFDTHRLMAALEKNAHLSAVQDIHQKIMEEILSWQATQKDDITLIIIQRSSAL